MTDSSPQNLIPRTLDIRVEVIYKEFCKISTIQRDSSLFAKEEQGQILQNFPRYGIEKKYSRLVQMYAPTCKLG